LELKIQQQSGQTGVVRLEGRLDANSAESFKTKFKEIVATGLTRLVVDMQAVNFIDSSGLSALVAGFRLLREQNGTLVLAQTGPQIKVALELTRLDRVFSVYPDLASALASLNKP
jgi:anti-sigma B factor antagonist